MTIVFSGTRGGDTLDGMTPAQIASVERIVSGIRHAPGNFALHGCCVGADAQFHAIARRAGWFIIGHPAFEVGHPMRADVDCDEIHPEMPPLYRNKTMVKEATLFIAAPFEAEEQERGGTWQATREARKCVEARRIVRPDGSIDLDRGAIIAKREDLTLFSTNQTRRRR